MHMLPSAGRIRNISVVASLLLIGPGLTTATVANAATTASASHAATAAPRAAAAVPTTNPAVPTGNPDAIVRSGTPPRTGVQPATAAPGGYGPSDLRSAYNLASAANTGGKGATVSVIGAYGDPTAAADLSIYRKQFGLPACTTANGCLREINENGQASPLPTDQNEGASWAETASMDMDTVSAICPNCHILLVEAESASPLDMGPAVDTAVGLGAKYVLVGWDNDSFNAAADAEYFNHPGVAIVAPAGDSGFIQEPFDVPGLDYPATSPYVTAVGGTTLTKSSNARGWTETVWGPPTTDPPLGATTSQCDTSFGKPSWQTDTGCAGRTTNDVAADADPKTGVAFYDTADGDDGWAIGGGTTVAASIVSAVYALAGTPASRTYPASYPYEHTTDLNPVTSGSDAPGGSCAPDPAYLCTAGPGYNGPAGWGTPDGTAAFKAPAANTVGMIAPLAHTDQLLPASVSIPIAAQDSAGLPLTYTATGLPPGVSIDPATGVISGTISGYSDGTVSITATDTSGASATASFHWLAENEVSGGVPQTQQTQPDTQVSLQIHGGDNDKSATLAYAATGLPPGLSINSDTGLISGTTSSAIGSYDVMITITDSTGSFSAFSFIWHVWNTITLTVPAQEEQITAGDRIAITVPATDSAPGQTVSFTAQGLPSGLSIGPSTGVISGVPVAAGPFDVTVTATDSTGSAGSASFSILLSGRISIASPGTLTNGVGQAVDRTFKVTDTASQDNVSYTMTGAPPGLEIDSPAPQISGWPAKAGTYHTTLTATGLGNSTASVSFTWTVTAAPDSGPSGPVRLDLDNKCLDDTGNSAKDGNKIQIWTCNGGASQRWTFAKDGTLRIDGKCLDLTGNGRTAGTKLQLWSCTGGTNQQWVVGTDAELVNPDSFLCLTDPNGSTKNGIQQQLGGCGQGDRGSWTLPAGLILASTPDRCADDYQGKTTPGTKVDSASCDQTGGQEWTVEPDGTIRVNGKCMAVGAASGGIGTPIVLQTCQSGDYAQQWSSLSIGGVVTEIETQTSGFGDRCLADPGTSGTAGVQLAINNCASLESEWHAW
jgi:hypothetical protein